MHIPRFYQSVSLTLDAMIHLDETASHHLLHVLRHKLHEPVIVFNGQGGEYVGTLASFTKKQAVIKLEKFIDVDRESKLKLHLAQAIARGDKMDWILQKAVELGVTEISPIITEYCNVKLSEDRWQKKLLHWESVIIHACEQSGRTRKPTLNPIRLFSQFIAQPMPDLKLLLHPYATDHLRQLAPQMDVVLCIGSEGGLSTQEVELAERYHFKGLQFGPRILRTETAGLALLAALQGAWGDAG